MRVVLVAPRCPWPPVSGDRVRAQMWIDALSGVASLHLITTPCACRVESGERFQVTRVKRSMPALLRTLFAIAINRAPLHSAITGIYEWRQALRLAANVDTEIVLLSRTAVWTEDSSFDRRRLLDAIDSASAGMKERSRAARSPLSLLWRFEAARCALLEERLGREFDVVLAVGPSDAAALGNALVVPLGIDARPLDENADRAFDFGFLGRLAYFANADAAKWLLESIWPRIRAKLPAANLLIAGADAPRWLRSRHGRDGVAVISPVDDPHAQLRSVRIALLPLRFGTGVSLKTMEAAEAGCAIVGTAAAFRNLPELASRAAVTESDALIAESAVALRSDLSAAREMGLALRSAVLRYHDRDAAVSQLRAAAQGVEREP